MVLYSRDRRIWPFVIFHLCIRNDADSAGPVRSIHDRAFVAHHNRAGIDGFLVLLQLRRTQNFFRAGVPMHLDWPVLGVGWKIVGDDFAFRERVALYVWVVVPYLGLDGGRRSQVQRPENRIDDMTSPVAHCAVAEWHPTA